MVDPLAQFRKTPLIPPLRMAGEKTKSTDEYTAFGTKDKVLRLRIRCAMTPTHSPFYANLSDIVYDGHYGTNFVLYYGFLMVLVRGKNLQSLIFALENGMADFIQEFDPDRWAKPTDETAAFIQSIEVVVPKGASSIPGTEKAEETN